MARKETVYTVTAEGRDFGKSFLITEMDADKAERWAIRVFLALAKSGVDIPEDVMNAGIAGMATLGLRALAGVNYEEAAPLLDEMMACVKFRPDVNRSEIPDRRLTSVDVEEVKTYLSLRAAIMELHTGFSFAAMLST